MTPADWFLVAILGWVLWRVGRNVASAEAQRRQDKYWFLNE